MKDLVLAVADICQEKVLEGLLPRIPHASNTRQFTYDIIRNSEKDSGSYNISQELLRPFINDYSYALVIFDYEGCGVEHEKSRVQIEQDVEGRLSTHGWANRNSVIVIEPELENWMWVDNINVQNAINWERQESLYEWARNKGFIVGDQTKPIRPKENLDEALKISSTPRSSSIYKNIASTVSYRGCQDLAFIKLIQTLQNWFGNN